MRKKEREIIEFLKKKIQPKRKDIITGIGDDTAVVVWDKEFYLLLTTDVVVEDVHFRLKDATPYRIGWKALAVNLSDIAAMGGIPLYCLISLGLPKGNLKLVEGIYEGIGTLAEKVGVEVVGGNISKSKVLFVDVFLTGRVEKRYLKLRSTAKPTNLIYVTGKLGASQIKKHLEFEPRIKEARVLVESVGVSSMIDISDGLSSDLIKLAESSNVGFKLYLDKIPISEGAKRMSKTEEEMVTHALSDGEDYELLFTVPKEHLEAVPKIIGSVPITQIGEILPERQYTGLLKGKEIKIKEVGFNHFK